MGRDSTFACQAEARRDLCLEGAFRVITEPGPRRRGQPTHCAEPVMWRYRPGATDSTIRRRDDLPQSPIQSASGPMDSEEEVQYTNSRRFVGPIGEERNAAFGQVDPCNDRVARHLPRAPYRQRRSAAVWPRHLELACAVWVVTARQIPNEPARLVNIPPLSRDGDLVPVFCKGLL